MHRLIRSVSIFTVFDSDDYKSGNVGADDKTNGGSVPCNPEYAFSDLAHGYGPGRTVPSFSEDALEFTMVQRTNSNTTV